VFNSKNNSATPPAPAAKLLRWCVPKYDIESILGDLEEEFYLRAKHNVFAAKRWFWEQSLYSSGAYLKHRAASLAFLQKFTVLFSLCLFVVIAQLIIWLSFSDSLDNFSPHFWDTLTSGYIHMAVFESAFWQHSFASWQEINAWSFILDSSAMVLTLFSSCLFALLNRRRKFLAHQILLFGYSAMFIPYIFGIGYINVLSLPALKVGPILLTMLCNVLYLLFPVVYLVLRKIKLQNTNLNS
jgi:hypothetical protein